MSRKSKYHDFIYLRNGPAYHIADRIVELMSSEFGCDNVDMYLDYIHCATPQELARKRKMNVLSVKVIIKAMNDRIAGVFSDAHLQLILAASQAGADFTIISNEELLALRKAAGLIAEPAPVPAATEPEVVKTSIEQLGLATRFKNIIYGQKINFVEDLITYEWEHFRQIRGGGPAFRGALERALRSLGLKMRESEPPL
jgi:hypothetical protein